MQEQFFIWNGKKLQRINPRDVILIETKGNYTHLYVVGRDSSIELRSTFTEVMSKLPADLIVQVHRSIAVSISHIDYIEKERLFMYKTEVPIARSYYDTLIERLKIIE